MVQENSDAGKYYYDFTSADDATLGRYDVLFVAVDNGRTIKQRASFDIVL